MPWPGSGKNVEAARVLGAVLGGLILVGTSMSVLVMKPSTTATRAARMGSGGMPKSRTPSSMTQLLVELTAQISQPAA